MWTKGDKASPDEQAARVAARQHGVITRRQLLEAGLLSSGIAVRLNAGRLHRIHRGVYPVGHSGLSQGGRWMAAVLACGEGAVLSHRSAAQLWGVDRRARRLSQAGGRNVAVVDVTVQGTPGRRRRAGIALHRSTSVRPAHCMKRNGIPVTTPARTLSDLRKVVPAEEFASAVREAEFLGLSLGDGLRMDHTQ